MNLPAPVRTISNAEYHSQRGRWSSSRLKDFRKSPALAKAKYIDGEESRPPTKAMVRGTLTHELVLDATKRIFFNPERLDQDYCVIPYPDLRKKEAKDWVAEEFEKNPNRIFIKEKDFTVPFAMADKIINPTTEAAKVAKRLLRDLEGHSEWYGEATLPQGVPGQCLIDRLVIVTSELWLGDYKTDRDPPLCDESGERWRYRTARKFGYNHQLAFNGEMIKAITGSYPDKYFWVVQRNAPPYEVVTIHPNEEDMEMARNELGIDFIKLSECLSGARPWAHDWENLEARVIPCL